MFFKLIIDRNKFSKFITIKVNHRDLLDFFCANTSKIATFGFFGISSDSNINSGFNINNYFLQLSQVRSCKTRLFLFEHFVFLSINGV